MSAKKMIRPMSQRTINQQQSHLTAETEPKEVRKPGPIQQQLDELGMLICVAHEALGMLERKLQPVRYSVPKTGAEGKAGEPSANSDVCISVISCNRRVSELIARIQELADEVEL